MWKARVQQGWGLGRLEQSPGLLLLLEGAAFNLYCTEALIVHSASRLSIRRAPRVNLSELLGSGIAFVAIFMLIIHCDAFSS